MYGWYNVYVIKLYNCSLKLNIIVNVHATKVGKHLGVSIYISFHIFGRDVNQIWHAYSLLNGTN